MNFISGFIIIIIALMTIKTDAGNIDALYALQSAPGVFMNFATSIIDGIKSMFVHPENISGIIGIATYTSEAVADG